MRSKDTCRPKSKTLSKWEERAAVRRTTFDKKLVRITEKVLKQVFGEDATTSICKYLDKNYYLKLEDIPSRLDTFSEALESYLSSGATVIETIILENICSNSGAKLKRMEEKTFLERVSELKRIHKV